MQIRNPKHEIRNQRLGFRISDLGFRVSRGYSSLAQQRRLAAALQQFLASAVAAQQAP